MCSLCWSETSSKSSVIVRSMHERDGITLDKVAKASERNLEIFHIPLFLLLLTLLHTRNCDEHELYMHTFFELNSSTKIVDSHPKQPCAAAALTIRERRGIKKILHRWAHKPSATITRNPCRNKRKNAWNFHTALNGYNAAVAIAWTTWTVHITTLPLFHSRKEWEYEIKIRKKVTAVVN